MTEPTTDREVGEVKGQLSVLLPILTRLEDRVHNIEKRVWMAAGAAVLVSEMIAKVDWTALFGHAAKASGLQ